MSFEHEETKDSVTRACRDVMSDQCLYGKKNYFYEEYVVAWSDHENKKWGNKCGGEK